MIRENLSRCKKTLKPLFVLGALMFFVFLLPFKTYSQYNVSGNNHTEIKYNQIDTKDFQIVFPDYYEPKAQELARILDTLIPKISESLTTTTPKVPILLHPPSAKSNGLAVWAPKRMEFWSSPSMDNYAYPYFWQLALHEYRHSSQMQALNVGITKWMGKIFGEHIPGAVCGIWLPYWFLEGDAVVAETALSPTGRGQTPTYNMYFKAMIETGKLYKPDKMLLGSMKDFVLDEYALGYFMVSYARKKYGKDIWGDCLENVGRNWWRLTSFGKTRNSNKNISFNDLYKETLSFMQSQWQEKENTKDTTTIPIIKQWNKENKEYCNYKNPIQINDTTVFAIKTSQFESQQLVRITPSEERKVLFLPYLENYYFDYKDSCILYAQYSPNIRWQQESNSDIIEYDLKQDKYRRITSNSIFFNPVYHFSDSLLVAIRTDSLDNQSLSIIAPDSKFLRYRKINEIIHSSFLKDKYLKGSYGFSYPAIDKASGNIFLISTDANGKHIVRYNQNTDDFTEVSKSSYDNISKLKIFNNRVYFIKDIDNCSQIVSININDTSDMQIHTNEKYGVDSYFIYDSTICLSTYTANGFRIVSLPYFAKAYNLNQTSPLFDLTIINQEQENFILNKDMIKKDTVFEVKKYNKFWHGINIHSWAPIFVDIQSQELGWGASIMSQNLLSTSVLSAGYNYHINDKNTLFVHYTFSALYPILDFTLNFRPRDVSRNLDSNLVKYLNFDEISLKTDITLPFTWTNRNFYNNLNISFHYSLTNIFNNETKVPITLFNSMGYSLQLANYASQASNDLYPRWGHITSIKYTRTLTLENAYILSFSSQVFIPGLWRNHSFAITSSWQINTPDIYYFPNEVNFVRGMYTILPKKYCGLLLTYNFPIIYPDSGIKNLLYIKRLIARPFYNVGSYDKEIFRSFGSDILAKIHVFTITFPLDVGIRMGYVHKTKQTFASLLFNISI
ncbi:MAG: hypothetical protein Q4Q06_01060 [Bacteroidota bacterium]|nr:hypothetical protein [Bacteroidota bacterium]